jgi:hypothetical protein
MTDNETRAHAQLAQLDNGFFMQIAVKALVYAILAIAEAIRESPDSQYHPNSWEER